MGKFSIPVFLLVSIFLFGFVSADLAVVGKVVSKSSGYQDGVQGVYLNITCDGNFKETFTNNPEGVYGIIFEESICSSEANVKVILLNTSTDYFNTWVVVDISDSSEIVLTPVVSSSGGGGHGTGCIPSFWDCSPEWSVCEGGAQTRVCSSNCGTTRVESQICTVAGEESESLNLDQSVVPEEPKGFFSTITGAVINNLGTGGIVGIGILIVGVVGGFGFVAYKRSASKK